MVWVTAAPPISDNNVAASPTPLPSTLFLQPWLINAHIRGSFLCLQHAASCIRLSLNDDDSSSNNTKNKTTISTPPPPSPPPPSTTTTTFNTTTLMLLPTPTGSSAGSMLLEVVVAVMAVMLSVKVYCTITAGRCRSTRSMAGKTVIVTGATAGIGKETARDLLRRGARVIIACRNMEKGARVAGELRSDVDGIGEVVVRHLDTSVLASVRTFAKEVLAAEKVIHVLVNNAGILGPEKRQVTADGLELTMATNHFGHFLLTNLLLGRLKESAPSRIVNVSSMGYRWPREKDLNDLAMNNKYTTFHAAYVSKLCTVLFTRELADKLAGTGVTANSLHPGFVRTDIFPNRVDWFTITIAFSKLFAAKDEATGAQTNIYLAVSEEVEGVTGRYFSDCKEEAITELARRKDLATSLWQASVKAVGLQQHETHC